MNVLAEKVTAAGRAAAIIGRDGTVERWNIHQRVQHFLLMGSVATLCLTGFPIKYANAMWSGWVIRAIGGFQNLLLVHKAAAVILGATGVYHLGYLIAAGLRYGFKPTCLFNFRDLKDALQHYGYLLGLAKDPPRYGRYSYIEKFEYFAVLWGMVVMGGSGLVLWFPQVAARWLPRWAIDAIRVVHSNEAFLAILALVFGHFFMVHLKPEVFPTNPSWFTGRIPLHLLAEEHPLELEELGLAEHAEAHGAYHASRWSRSRTLIYFELAIYGLIVFVLLAVFFPLLLE